MDQLSLGIFSRSRKDGERRLPIHPVHFERIGRDLRRRIYLEHGYGELFGVPDEEFGQRLEAFVVLDEGAVISEPELQDHVKRNLARHKVPREIVFLDELPRNATGKVLGRELLSMSGGRERVAEN